MQSAALSSERLPLQAKAWDVFRAHVWLLALVGSYCTLLVALAPRFGQPAELSISLYWIALAMATPAFAVIFFLCRSTYIAATVRPPHVGRYMLGEIRSKILAPERLMAALPIVLLLPIFMSTFSSFKALIPAIQPFAWDATFAEWDRVLHFGRHPWEWLQPLLGHPWITTAINGVYNLWFFVLFAMWMWQAFSGRDPVLRMRFILSFILLWVVLGSGMASLLSSAGPCYFDRVTGLAENPYAGLMEYLNQASLQAPVWALEIQERLWLDYLEPGVHLGSGISAMPSLHVATTVLFALLGWRIHRRLGWALTAFAAVVMLGSVHLGWHYAVDGYVSIVATVAIWHGVGWLLARDGFFRRLAAEPGQRR